MKEEFMSLFLCPTCKSPLVKKDNCYLCENGHNFDISSKGYVNLLISQKSSLKRHGDDNKMVKARTAFLDGTFYKPLLESICNILKESLTDDCTILDVGCGEGYYTDGISKSFGCNATVYGTDISKYAIGSACRRCKKVKFCVSSVSELPFKSTSFNSIINIFAPYNQFEFYRVLKNNGLFLRVTPLENHLFSLKKVIYDNPYVNTIEDSNISGFKPIVQKKLKYKFTVENEQIQNLFMMTPYYYKTSIKDQSKLKLIDKLETEAEFSIILYKKI